MRIFDALNDVRNLQTAIDAAKKYGGHVQAAISYTTGPVFDIDYYCNYAKQLENAGADSICIKDMAGLLTPYGTYDLVKALKSTVDIPVQLHSHYTSGLASMVHLKGIEAGVDVIDTAMSPLAMGTSHPATESMVAALKGTEYDTGLDIKALSEIRDFFTPLREKYLASGLLDPKMLGVDANTLLYQVPGGMLSNLVSQLKQAGKADKLDEVLAEVPRVRKDSGYPPLVTPTSQIVGTQAVFNVIMGERYKMVTKEFKDLVAGKYGKTPCDIDPDFQKKIVAMMKLSLAVLRILFMIRLMISRMKLKSIMSRRRISFHMLSSVRLLLNSSKREEIKNTTLMASMRILNQRFTLFNYSIT